MTGDRPIDYRGRRYTAEAFERQFNPRAHVASLGLDIDAIQAERNRLAEDARGRLGGALGVPYGDSDRQVLDVFGPNQASGEPGPALVFLHGGYWRAGHARDNSFFAEPFVAAGATVFVTTYDLCPQVTVADTVDQARRAVAWVHANARRYGADPERIYLSGHSAGAHLAAMALADPGGFDGGALGPEVAEAVRGAALISGVYDLEPVLSITVNAEIRLRPEDVTPLSPLAHPPARPIPMILSVGLGESEEWVRQSRLYAAAAKRAGCSVSLIELPGADHYSILFPMREADHAVTRAMVEMMGLTPS